MSQELAVRHDLPARNEPDDLDARAKQALDDVARKIGRAAVNHLKEMYPGAMEAVVKNAEISLTNHIRNDINYHMRPLLKMLVEAHKRGAI